MRWPYHITLLPRRIIVNWLYYQIRGNRCYGHDATKAPRSLGRIVFTREFSRVSVTPKNITRVPTGFKSRRKKIQEEVHEGSGNVFADLGQNRPKDRQTKARLALYIERLIEAADWTQTEAAQRMGLAQSDVSNIVNGRLKGFTLDRLFQCLDALDQDIEIGITSRKNSADPKKILVPYR